MTTEQIFQNLMLVIGGLALFLYAIELMSASLKNAAGNKLKIIIEKSTNTVWKGILVGVVLTALIQSSSAVTVIIIGLVSVDLMTLKQAAAVVIGANIGTTVTSILIGLPVAKWGLWFIAIGVLIFFIFSRKVPRNIGRSIIGFGLLFVGLQFLGQGVSDIAQAQWAQDALRTFGDPSVKGFWIYGFGFSTAFTMLIQSSSGTVGVIQKLYDIDTITVIGAIPMVLGANVGTTITGGLAAIKGNKNSKRVALIHTIYNIIGTILIMPFISPISKVLVSIEDKFLTPDTKMMTIALIHMFINIATMLVFVWIIDPIVKLTTIIIKDKKRDDELARVLDERILIGTPSIALSYAKSGIFMMSDIVYEHLQTIRHFHLENKSKYLDLNEELENKIDDYDQRLHKYMIDLVQKNDLTESDSLLFSGYLDIINDLERIGDHLHNIGVLIGQRYEYGLETPQIMIEELNRFYDLIEKMMGNSFAAFSKKNLKLALEVIDDEIQADIYEKEFKHAHTERLREGIIVLSTENNYPDLLSNLERIADHLTNISETVLLIYQPQPKKATVFGR
ncbi:MAG: Na/Pi cotransporter family protein [Acholeplasmataceae bacterium]|jgi:phosphate:Na+ symporter